MVQVKFLKESPGRLQFLSLEEEAKLCEALGPPYGDWVRLAILTGMRQMEQFSLRWEHVDLERGLLTIPHTKAGGTRYVHLNVEGMALLRGFTSSMVSQWVLPTPGGPKRTTFSVRSMKLTPANSRTTLRSSEG